MHKSALIIIMHKRVPSRICSHAERDLEARAGTAGQPIVTPE